MPPLPLPPSSSGPALSGDVNRETLFLVSSINALLQGVYDGSISFDDLERVEK